MHAPLGVRRASVLSPKRRPFFHVWEEAELNNGPFDLNSKVHFRQTYTWFLPTTTHSAIEYP